MKTEYKQFFEMANIPQKKTGLNFFIQIRPEERHIYFPHVHCVNKLTKQEEEYVKVSLSKSADDISIIEEHNMKLSNKQFKQLKIFIMKNYDKLFIYYTKAEYIPDSGEFLSNFYKI